MKRKLKAARDDYPPWEKGPISRERWRRHRALMMERSPSGRRPEEWWLYERDREEPENQTSVLYGMGEIKGGELDQLMHWWRDYYDRASNYSAAERRAYLRDMDIPPEIIAKWDAEQKKPA